MSDAWRRLEGMSGALTHDLGTPRTTYLASDLRLLTS